MTSEATVFLETDLAIPFTVADGTAITKGSLLKLTSPMTAIITSGNQDILAGIAASDKIANDGVTKLDVYREGYFVMVASGSITAGDALASAGAAFPNRVYLAPASTSGSQLLGRALETVTTGQSLVVDVDVGNIQGAGVTSGA